MVYHFGKSGYMSLQIQAAEGTVDAFSGGAGEVGLPITSQPNMKPIIEKEFKQYYKKLYNGASDYTVKRLAAEGTIEVPAFTGGPLEALMYGVFGSVTSTVVADTTTAYSNIFVMDDTLPIFSAAVGRDALDYQSFYDLRLGSLDITMSPGDDIMLSSSALGKGGSIAAAQNAYTPAYTAFRSFAFDDVGVSLGGAPNCDVTELSLKIDRGMKSMRTACAAAAKGDNMIYPTGIDVSGSMTLLFQDYTEYSYWLGGSGILDPTFDQTVADTKRALTITATGEPVGDGTPVQLANMILTLPAIVYETAEIDMPFDDRMMIKVDFKALHDSTAETALAGTGTIKGEVISQYDADSVLV